MKQHHGNPDPDSAASWLRLLLSLALGTIGSVGTWAVLVVLPAVQAEFGVDRAAAALPFTLVMTGFAIGNVAAGRVVDRIGIMLPALGAGIVLSLGFLAAAFSSSITIFSLLHLLIGLGTSVTFGPIIADVSHWFRRYRGIAVATAATGNYLAGAIWPVAMRGFVEDDGWRATYLGIAVLVLITMLPLSLLLRKPAPVDAHPEAARSRSLPANRTNLSPRALQLILIVAGLSCCVAMAMPQVHIVAYCVDLGYGMARGSEMLSLMLVGGIASRLLSGVLADHIGGVRTALLGSFLQALSLLLFIPFDGLASLYMVSLIFGLSQGGIVPSYAIIIREYLPAREAGQRVGVVIMATLVGMAVGGWMSGFIYDLTGSYRAAFLNGIAWNLLNLAAIAVILWRSSRFRKAIAA